MIAFLQVQCILCLCHIQAVNHYTGGMHYLTVVAEIHCKTHKRIIKKQKKQVL